MRVTPPIRLLKPVRPPPPAPGSPCFTFSLSPKVANGCEFPLEAILLLYFYTYTCTFWKLLNQNLKPSGSAKEAVQARTWNPIINMLQRTLNLLPSPRGPEFQTAYVVCSSVQYDVVESEGVVITVPIFLSATSDFQLARLLIKACTATICLMPYLLCHGPFPIPSLNRAGLQEPLFFWCDRS